MLLLSSFYLTVSCIRFYSTIKQNGCPSTARGLLVGDEEYERTLAEAVSYQVNTRHLRELFAVILLECQPARPERLWEQFKAELSSDFTYARRQAERDLSLPFSQENDGDRALRDIGTILSANGRCLAEWCTRPQPPPAPDAPTEEAYCIREQLAFGREPLVLARTVAERILKLYPAQRALYDEIVAAIDDTGPARDRTFFIHAAGKYCHMRRQFFLLLSIVFLMSLIIYSVCSKQAGAAKPSCCNCCWIRCAPEVRSR